MASLITFRNMAMLTSVVHVAYGVPAVFSPKTFLRLIGSTETPANVRSLKEYAPFSGVYFLGVAGIFYVLYDSTDIVLQRRIAGLSVVWIAGNILATIYRHRKIKRWEPIAMNFTTWSLFGLNVSYLAAYACLYNKLRA